MTDLTNAAVAGRYVDVAGHANWVMEAGTGAPLILLHGGLDSSAQFFGAIGSGLAAGRRVIAFDRRGHGRTADTEADFHYSAMADETLALMAALGLTVADFCGWSDGGIVALLLALRRPDAVRRMVLIGANFHCDAIGPALLDPAAHWLPGAAKAYAAISPDPAEHFNEIVRKTFALWRSEPILTAADLVTITTPTLVLNGDRDDIIALAHTVALFEAIPGAQLAIIPGATHFVPTEKPATTVAAIETFLA